MARLIGYLRLFRFPRWLLPISIKPVLFLAAVLSLLRAGLALFGCGVEVGSGSPAFSVLQVTDLGPIPTNRDILGRDGGYSALFQGYSVWLYGDMFLASPNSEGFTLISDHSLIPTTSLCRVVLRDFTSGWTLLTHRNDSPAYPGRRGL